MGEKKKMSIGKIWILVCVIAVILGLLVSFVGFIAPEMEEYNNHEHDGECYVWDDWTSKEVLYCYYTDYDSAWSYAMSKDHSHIIFGVGALLLANVVMLFVWLARRNSKKIADTVSTDLPTAPVAPISTPIYIPTGTSEQVVLERHYPSAFPVVLMVLGVLEALLGIFYIVDYDEEVGIPLLILGAIFLIVGIILCKALKIHLVVTTKRVYLKAPFAARLNLPLRRISAVGTGLFHYLTITSAAGFAGQIRLWFVPKYLEVYDTINALLNDVE